jgi:hypothetical protein
MAPGDETGIRLIRSGAGYAAAGPGFYVWDLEPRAVIEGARALARSSAAPQPARPTPLRRPATKRRRRTG